MPSEGARNENSTPSLPESPRLPVRPPRCHRVPRRSQRHAPKHRECVRLRRVFTPTVTGTVVMLIAATIMPIVFGLLEIPAAVAPDAVIASACATLGTFLAIALWVGCAWRLWASVGSCHRNRRGLLGGGGAVVRYSGPSLAGLRSRVRPVVLALAAFVRVRHDHRRRGNDRRRDCHPAGLVAQGPGGRLQGCPGCCRCRRHWQPAFRTLGDGAQHNLFQ